MPHKGPILLLEDDKDDIDVLEQAFEKLGLPNPRRYFEDGQQIIDYLRTTPEPPFIIFSDVKLRRMNGLELREKIQTDDLLRKKGIPFIFLSLDVRKEVVEKAYDLTVQGFFEKADTVTGVEDQLRSIIDYWQACRHPNS